MKRLLQLLAALFLLTGLCGIAALGILFVASEGDPVDAIQIALLRFTLAGRQTELETPAGADDSLVRFTIAPGDTPAVIARNLASARLIQDAQLFVDYLRLERLDTQIQASTYFLSQTQTIPQIARTIIDSRNSSITFRVVEGSRLEEIAASIESDRRFGFSGQDFLAAARADAGVDAALLARLGVPADATLEGFMLPETYVLPPDITAAGLRDTLLEQFVASVGDAWFSDAAAQGYTARDMVTLASIVERESVFGDEDALIASVYRNRLNIGMLLQADPTVQYGLNGARGAWWPQITQADYQNVASRYNTYLYPGLPPGPIANPGISALRAAVYPQQSPYFFFRALCDGSNRHVFAVTYEEHLANGC